MIAASIVVAGNGDEAPWRRCLEALRPQVGPDAEVIVAAGSAPLAVKLVAQGLIPAQVVERPDREPLQALRAAGLARAKGDIIAFLDCFSIVQPGWLAALLEAHRRRPHQAIGGAVDLADAESGNLARWAAYINEYGMFMPPFEASERPLLPGCNLSYKRQALFQDGLPRTEEFWKTFVNADLRGSSGLWVEPDIAVHLDKPIGFVDYWLTRFDHGRCYAAMRADRMPLWERAARALATPVLPLVLFARWAAEYWARGHRRSKLLLTSPLQLLLFGWWALGEGVGYLWGPGTACRKLFY